MPCELPCQVHAYPLQLTNIKYYNKYLDETEATTEAIKYTTNHKVVFNDLARPINSGHGYDYCSSFKVQFETLHHNNIINFSVSR